MGLPQSSMDLNKKDQTGDSECTVKLKGESKHTMFYTTNFICKFDPHISKKRPTSSVVNANPPYMNIVCKRDNKKTIKVKDSKNDKKDIKKTKKDKKPKK